MENHASIVQDLIDAGANINSATDDGVTSLMFGKFHFKNFLIIKYFLIFFVKPLKRVIYQ